MRGVDATNQTDKGEMACEIVGLPRGAVRCVADAEGVKKTYRTDAPVSAYTMKRM